MKWKKRDLGSDPMNPIYVTTELPVVDGKIAVDIPVDAYKRLADWASMGRTMNNVIQHLDNDLALEEIAMLRKSLEEIHGAIRNHYLALPGKEIS